MRSSIGRCHRGHGVAAGRARFLLPAVRGKGEVQQLVAARSAGAAQAPWGEVAQDAQEAQAADRPRAVDADAAVQVALLKSPRRCGRCLPTWASRRRMSTTRRDCRILPWVSKACQPAAGARRRPGRSRRASWKSSSRWPAEDALLESQQRVAHEFLQLEADVRSGAEGRCGGPAVSATAFRSKRGHVSAELAGRFTRLEHQRPGAGAGLQPVPRIFRAQDAQVAATRARLLALMEMEDRPDINLSDRLLLPAKLDIDLKSLQATALEQRLDLQALRTQVEWSGSKEAFTNRWPAGSMAWASRQSTSAKRTGTR